jgi:hypothetical protein
VSLLICVPSTSTTLTPLTTLNTPTTLNTLATLNTLDKLHTRNTLNTRIVVSLDGRLVFRQLHWMLAGVLSVLSEPQLLLVQQ